MAHICQFVQQISTSVMVVIRVEMDGTNQHDHDGNFHLLTT